MGIRETLPYLFCEVFFVYFKSSERVCSEALVLRAYEIPGVFSSEVIRTALQNVHILIGLTSD